MTGNTKSGDCYVRHYTYRLIVSALTAAGCAPQVADTRRKSGSSVEYALLSRSTARATLSL